MGICDSRPEWTDPVQNEVRRLWASRTRAFEPDTDPHAMRLLRSYWRVVLPASPFQRTGPQWSSIGFQGKDPVTDVRAGGLLSVMCLEHFSSFYTFGTRQMLIDLRRLERQEGSAEKFYPLSTSAIVICVMLCDLIGISKGMRGVISEEQLEQLLTKSPRLAISVLLTKDGPHVGFQELFSFALAHFHVEFLRRDITYMESPELAREVVQELEVRAKGHKTINSLRLAYCDMDPAIERLLTRAGGEACGWRLARGIHHANRVRKGCSLQGIIFDLHRDAQRPSEAKPAQTDVRWIGTEYAAEEDVVVSRL
eukprot:m.111645 g.111645  ORF g.111645 m.111645 type:complete len:310 (+) comp21375_c0_seq2:504-1433(+)